MSTHCVRVAELACDWDIVCTRKRRNRFLIRSLKCTLAAVFQRGRLFVWLLAVSVVLRRGLAVFDGLLSLVLCGRRRRRGSHWANGELRRLARELHRRARVDALQVLLQAVVLLLLLLLLLVLTELELLPRDRLRRRK